MRLAARQRFLTLPDIAALARVQRPVVTMWLSRSAGTATPFPDAVVGTGSRRLFALEAVVEWLVSTGHGNNPHVREEAALFVALDVSPGTSVQAQLSGLTAMLALHAATGSVGGRTARELVDLADDVDPFDAFLYAEVAALGEAASEVAATAAAMSSAAFTPAHAFAALMANRHRLDLRGHAATAMDPKLIDLVAGVAAALLRASVALPALVAPEASDDLVVGLTKHLADDEPSVLLLPPTSSAVDRLVRRRSLTLGWPVRDLASEDGHLLLPDGCVVLAQYPSPTHPYLSDIDVLDRIEEIALGMHDADTAVVVGPASALVNRSRDAALTGRRATVLRTGRVRAVVRLSAGLWLSRSRQVLAMWVLGPAHPDVPADDRWVTVADLAGRALDAAARDDVVSDVLASMGSRRDVYAHASRFARIVPARDLIAARGDLVGAPRAALRLARRTPVQTALAVAELTERVSGPPVGLSAWTVEHHDPSSARTATLGQLVEQKAVRALPGNRIASADLRAGGVVRVLGTDELLGTRPVGQRTVDRLAFAATPSARYTEPGDIVFCATPRPGAMVDIAGFSAVLAPARILRVVPRTDSGVVTQVIARAMRAAPRGVPWRSWSAPLIPPAQAPRLGRALDEVAASGAELRARLDALDSLAALLTDSVSTGTLTLNLAAPAVDDPQEQEG